jgi:hypothetical protein
MDPLAQYIVRNYAPLMRPAEAAAHQRLMLTNRATGGDTSPEAQERVTASTPRPVATTPRCSRWRAWASSCSSSGSPTASSGTTAAS